MKKFNSEIQNSEIRGEILLTAIFVIIALVVILTWGN